MQSDIDGGTRHGTRTHHHVRLSSDAVPYWLAMSDAFVILVASVLGGIGYHLAIASPIAAITPYCTVGLFASFLYILRMSGTGHYELSESVKPQVEISSILLCWMTTGLLLVFVAFLLKFGVDYSRGAFVVFYFVSAIGLLAVRKATKVALGSAVSKHSLSRQDLVLIGDETEIATLKPQDMLTFFGAAEVNRFVLKGDCKTSIWSGADERMMERVISYVRGHDCREIALVMPWVQNERIDLVRDRIKVLPVAVRLLPDHRVRSLSNYGSSARQRVPAIEIQRAPLSAAERLAKRAMDLAIGSVALISLLPVFLLTAVAIKLDGPGPVIFSQRRKGFNGREFVMWKFRTMTVQEDGPVVSQAMRNDPRVTAIGRLLRSASIDELPQLINVLKGDMSLIGPRPHALAHDNYFQNLLSDYAFRHHVKPGLTGWAQCNGSRGATPSVEHIADRVKLDLWYINNWSLWLDIHILFKTFLEVVRERNAY